MKEKIILIMLFYIINVYTKEIKFQIRDSSLDVKRLKTSKNLK